MYCVYCDKLNMYFPSRRMFVQLGSLRFILGRICIMLYFNVEGFMFRRKVEVYVRRDTSERIRWYQER